MSKKFKSKFYNIDYYKSIKTQNASNDKYIPCKIFGEITKKMIFKIKKEFGFVPDGYSKLQIDKMSDENDKLLLLAGSVPKIHLADLTSYTKKKLLSFTYEKYIWEKIFNKDGYLYSGWKTGIGTKIKPEDLPESYVYISNYKKHGYLETSNVVDLLYKPCEYTNHAFKDDFLYISYKNQLHYDEEYPFDLFSKCDEYVFGHDMISVIKGIEKFNSENELLMNKLKDIKESMLKHYNMIAKLNGDNPLTLSELFK